MDVDHLPTARDTPEAVLGVGVPDGGVPGGFHPVRVWGQPYYAPYYAPYYGYYRGYYPPPVVYAPPAVTYSQAPPASYAPPAPQVQNEVVYPHGKYVLRGYGVATAYQWVWIPNPPPAPPQEPAGPAPPTR